MRDKIQIRVNLEGERAKQFEVIKKDLGVKNDSEVVRHLIVQAAKNVYPDLPFKKNDIKDK